MDPNRVNVARSGRTMMKKKAVRSDESRMIRARGTKVDNLTVQTVFADGSKSFLLEPNNAGQERAVEERLQELALGRIIKFYGMLTEYIRGCEGVSQVHAHTGYVQSLKSPTEVLLPDVRELK